MQLYLAGCESRHYVVTELLWGGIEQKCKKTTNEDIFSRSEQQESDTDRSDGGGMQLYLAGNGLWDYVAPEIKGGYEKGPYILESFYYADDLTKKLIPHMGDFMLDSGAFTYMNGTKGGADWESYIDKYADFINETKVDKFFELDIDSVIGYKNVLKLRKRLEQRTGKQPIPVWHKSRGKDYFISMCRDYKYVSIGGIVTKEIKPEEYKFFPWFIGKAHENGCRIHGLGFTNLKLLPKYHFDSVDSTAWTTGNRFGYLYRFDGKTIKKVQKKGYRLKDSRKAALNNFIEWVKYQDYADKYF